MRDLADAMEDIREEYILSAKEILEGAPGKRRGRAVKRALVTVAVAAALVMSTFTVAVAASPEFREAVLTFLHIEDSERVPEPGLPDRAVMGDQHMDVTGGDLGGVVDVTYIRTDRFLNEVGEDLFCEYEFDEELGTNWPSRYWTIRGGRAVEADIEPRRLDITVEHRGETYETVMDLYRWRGRLCIQDMSVRHVTEEGIDLNMGAAVLDDHTLLLTLIYARQMDARFWFMRYDLETGRAEDFLAGTPLEEMAGEEQLFDVLWAPDMSGAVLTFGRPGSTREYYMDMSTGALTDLGALEGVDLGAAVFADSRRLLLIEYYGPEDSARADAMDVWCYDLDTGIYRQTLPVTPRYYGTDGSPEGVWFFGTGVPYCLVVDEDGSVRAADLVTGSSAPIEGFTMDYDGDFMASPDGTRAMYSVCESEPEYHYRELGIVDFAKGTFLTFDREVPEGVVDSSISWLGNDRLMLRADGREGAGLYIYDFG